MNSSFDKYLSPAKSPVLFPPSAPDVQTLWLTCSVRLPYVTSPLLLVPFTEILKLPTLKELLDSGLG